MQVLVEYWTKSDSNMFEGNVVRGEIKAGVLVIDKNYSRPVFVCLCVKAKSNVGSKQKNSCFVHVLVTLKGSKQLRSCLFHQCHLVVIGVRSPISNFWQYGK